jgi:hypothetical protein
MTSDVPEEVVEQALTEKEAEALHEEIRTLKSERTDLRRDTARYQFLRALLTELHPISYHSMPRKLEFLRGIEGKEAFDKAVDGEREHYVPAETTL